MLHAGLDLSRRKIDVCLLSAGGEIVEEFASPPDADGLRGLTRRVGRHGLAVRGVIESMTGARFVHDRLEELGWDVLIADAAKVKGLAPLACKTDRIDARVLAVLSERDLVPEIWLPDPRVRRERELARFRMHLVKHRSMLKHRIHADADHLRAPVPGQRPVRRRRPRAGVPPVSWMSGGCAVWPAGEDVCRCQRHRRIRRGSGLRRCGC
jgi:transposase